MADDEATADEPIEEVNAGPHGGSYRNDNNSLEYGGESEEDEATSMTGAVMAAMSTEDRRGSIGGSQRSATDAEMRGGNA